MLKCCQTIPNTGGHQGSSPGEGMIDLWELEHVLGAAMMMWELLHLKISVLLLHSTWTD